MTPTEPATPTMTDVEPTSTVVVRGRVPTAELPSFFDRSFTAIMQACADQGIQPTGAAFARYHGTPAEISDLEVGFPVATEVTPAGEVQPGSLPGGRAVTHAHHGGYDGLPGAWQQMVDWIGQQGLTPTDTLWEVYVTEPGPEVDPATLRTDLFWVVDV